MSETFIILFSKNLIPLHVLMNIMLIQNGLGLKARFNEILAGKHSLFHSMNFEEVKIMKMEHCIWLYYIEISDSLDFSIRICDKIRAIDAVSFIVGITAKPSIMEFQQCREYGYDDYISLPMDELNLIDSVRTGQQLVKRWKGLIASERVPK